MLKLDGSSHFRQRLVLSTLARVGPAPPPLPPPRGPARHPARPPIACVPQYAARPPARGALPPPSAGAPPGRNSRRGGAEGRGSPRGDPPLLQRPIRIDRIRAKDQDPGLREFEANFLRLLDKMTNGSLVEINETGTALRYRPGYLTGGSVEHDCSGERGIGYYLEALVLLGLMGKRPLTVTLRGVTNHPRDPSVDTFRTVTLPLMKSLGLAEDFELRIVKRGAAPLGGGEVVLTVPCVKELRAVDLTDEGMVKRVRGIAYSMRTTPQNSNRMVDGARGVFNDFLADVYVFTDHMSGEKAGRSPGYGVVLVAETTTGCFVSAECCVDPDGDDPAERVPEDVGRKAANMLLEEVRRGGVVDSSHQAIVLTLCALGPPELSRVRLGPLAPYAVKQLRHLREFLGVKFTIKPENESKTVFLSCVGAGVKNTARRIQ